MCPLGCDFAKQFAFAKLVFANVVPFFNTWQFFQNALQIKLGRIMRFMA